MFPLLKSADFLHSKSYLNMEGIDLFCQDFVFCQHVVPKAKEGRKIQILRSARGKLITLKIREAGYFLED